MQNARWTSAIAVAALTALPIAASAQSPQSTPPQNPPTQQQPQQPPAQPPSDPTSQPPTTAQQPPTSAQPPATSAQQPPASGQVDAAAAKEHLSQARETLSSITTMPEAGKLQGEARTQVSQLITNFNALITTQAEWRAAYAKVDENLTALLGAEKPADQPVGTSGSSASSSLDPAIRAKLTEFRTHLKAFESAAGGAAPAPSSTSPSEPSSPTAPPNPSSPANPANPASASSPATPANPSNPPAATTSPTAKMDPADREKASSEVNAAPNADAQKELDAISAILSASKSGALTKAETSELKKHVETLRVLLAQK